MKDNNSLTSNDNVNKSHLVMKVGDSNCKSQEWLLSLKLQNHKCFKQPMRWEVFYQGKQKLQLCYASWLEEAILMSYGISIASVYSAFHEAAAWIPSTFQFPFGKWIISKDEAALNSVAEGFLSASGGVFRKCISALDDILAIKIKCPVASNLISNSGNYFAERGSMLWMYRPSLTNHDVYCGWMQVTRARHMIQRLFLKQLLFKILEDNSDWLTTKDISWSVILHAGWWVTSWYHILMPSPFLTRCLRFLLAVQQRNPNWMHIWQNRNALGNSMEEAAFRHTRRWQGSNSSNSPSNFS